MLLSLNCEHQHMLLTSNQNVLCIAENGIIAELELFLVLNRRTPLTSQAPNKLRQLHEAITLVDLMNRHIHYTECASSPHTIATTTTHSQYRYITKGIGFSASKVTITLCQSLCCCTSPNLIMLSLLQPFISFISDVIVSQHALGRLYTL